MKLVIGIVSLSAVLLLAFLAFAGGFSVHGRVYEKEKNQGLAGLRVKLKPKSSKATAHVTSTTDDGSYRFEGIAAGSYELEVFQGLKEVYSTSVSVSGDTTLDVALEVGKGAPRTTLGPVKLVEPRP